MPDQINSNILIGLVGPCKSGKSILKNILENEGYEVKHIAQEHSFSQTMWKVLTNPDILIYLDVSYENTISRGKLSWTKDDYQEQIRRLTHSFKNANLIINTDDYTEQNVSEIAIDYIKSSVV